MKFYNDKFKELRKQFGLTMKHVAKRAEITHTTLWEWEKGKRTPSETRVRMLAHVINVPVNEISNLDPEPPVSSNDFSEIVQSWINLAGADSQSRLNVQTDLISKLNYLFNELSQASIVIKALMSTMHSMFYVKDTNLKYITANEAFLKNSSMSLNFNVLDKSDEDFFPRSDAKVNTEQDYEVLHTGKALIKHECYIPGSRKKKWGILSKVPILDSNGKISGIVGTMLDITERKKNELIKDLISSSLDMIRDGFILMDSSNSRYLYVNSAVEKITGYPVKNFYNDCSFLIEKCVFKDDFQKEADYRLNKSWPLIRQYRIVKPNEDIRWIEETLYIPAKEDNKYCVLFLKDITERILSDAHKKRLGNCINQVSTIIWSGEFVNDEFKFLHVNDAVFDVFGVAKQEFLENKKIWSSLVFPEQKNIGTVYMTEQNKPKEFELKIIRPDGQVRWIHNKIMNDGNIYMGTSRDITTLI